MASVVIKLSNSRKKVLLGSSRNTRFQLRSSCQTVRTARLKMEKYSRDRDSSTKIALSMAVKENKIKKLQHLLTTKSWPNGYPYLDYELLVTAVKRGFKAIANVLLDHGARVFKGPNLNTPLHLAAAKSNDWLDVMERLMEKGARVSEKNRFTYTPLHVAFGVGSTDEKTDLLLQSHLRQSNENVVNISGLSFLHIACSRPHLEFVRKLVEANKASVNDCIIQSQCTPLHFAAEYGRHEIADYLVRHGANIYSQNYDLSTPIHLALTRRDIRMIDILLAQDKDRKNITNKYNLSHFMVACIGNKVDVVEDYLEMAECRYKIPSQDLINAQINNLSANEGYTALHLAVDLGTVEVVELLLSRGANCCAISATGDTPHVLAERRNYADMSKVLREHCYIVKKSVQARVESPDFGKYGAEYERNAVIERTRELKYLRETLKNLEAIKNSHIVSNDDDSNVEDLWDSV